MRKLLFAAAIFAIASLSTSAFATEFSVLEGTSNAQFTSDALLETITGTTSVLSGSLEVDINNPGATTGSINIDTASFRTGVDLRDEHLRGGDWLDAENHPQITFTLASVDIADGTALTHGTEVATTVTGTLSLHGTEQEITVPATVTYYEITDEQVSNAYGITNNILRVQTEFDVQLDEYGISIPAPLTAKVSNTISLNIRVTAQQAGDNEG